MLTVKINGDSWKVYFLSRKAYIKKCGKDSVGTTVYQHAKGFREINFLKPVAYSTIVHELIHAYLSYKDFSKLSYGRQEEETAEYLSKKFESLGSVAKHIVGAL